MAASQVTQSLVCILHWLFGREWQFQAVQIVSRSIVCVPNPVCTGTVTVHVQCVQVVQRWSTWHENTSSLRDTWRAVIKHLFWDFTAVSAHYKVYKWSGADVNNLIVENYNLFEFVLSHSNSSYDWFALIDCRIIRMFPSCSAEEHFSSWQDHLRAEPPVEWASWWSRCLRRLLRWIWSRCILHCRMNLSRYKNLHWTSRYLMGK